MDKRLPITIALCFLIITGWSLFFRPKPAPPVAGAQNPPAVSDGSTAGAPANGAPGQATQSAALANGQAPAPVLEQRGPRSVGSEERDLVLNVGRAGESGFYRAVFSNRGAALVELRTGNYFDHAGLSAEERQDFEHWTKLVTPIEIAPGVTTRSMVLRASPSSSKLAGDELDHELWKMTAIGPADAPTGVEFELAPGTGVRFVKRFTFAPGEYRLRLEFEVENQAFPEASGLKAFVLTPAACILGESQDRFYPEPQALAVSRPKGDENAQFDSKKNDGSKVLEGALNVGSPLSFAGVQNKYFAVLLHAADEDSRPTLTGASYRRLRDETFAREHPDQADRATRQVVADVQMEVLVPEVGASRKYAYDVYAGPKVRELLEKAWADHSVVLDKDLGWLASIASVLLYVLNLFHAVVRNWGVAIILLTLSVRALLFPINRRSQSAMARYQTKMKRLQPKIDELKKKCEKDPARQRQEQAKLMQQEGAFPPLGGCLPMFLQFPVFIGLFRALGVSFDLRHAPFFLWIQDLALPDHLMRLDFNTHLPILGTIEYLNILPLLMVGLMIFQQRSMPAPADEQAAKMQKMMMWMPVMFGFILYNYAAGLSLYSITSSSLGILEQRVIKKYWPVDDQEKPAKKSGFMTRLMEAQQTQQRKLQTKQPTRARKAKRP